MKKTTMLDPNMLKQHTTPSASILHRLWLLSEQSSLTKRNKFTNPVTITLQLPWEDPNTHRKQTLMQKRTVFVSCSSPCHHLHIDLLPSRKQYCSIKFQTGVQTRILAELELKVGELLTQQQIKLFLQNTGCRGK